MEKNGKAFESFLQVCTVVKDAKKAAETWEKVYGIGPWEIVHATEENCRGRKFHGVSIPDDEPHDAIVAMSELGNLYLEIIQPISGSSPYAEFLQEHGEGIHHLAIRQNDRFVPLMQERGNEEIFSVWIGDKFYAYYDTRKDLGFITETF